MPDRNEEQRKNVERKGKEHDGGKNKDYEGRGVKEEDKIGTGREMRLEEERGRQNIEGEAKRRRRRKMREL